MPSTHLVMKRPLLYGLALLLVAGGLMVVFQRLKNPAAPGQATADPMNHREGKAKAEAATSPTPALIRKLVDPSLHLQEQIDAVRALPSDLSEREFAALADLLRQPSPAAMKPSTWYVLLNEVMAVLEQPRFGWKAYGDVMAGLVSDREVDPVVRDYAAQYLSVWLGNDSATRPPESFASGMESFLTVLRGEREAREQVTGTILMSLCDLHDKQGDEPFKPFLQELSAAVTQYASGSRPSTMANQISAIQAAGRMNLREALPAIRAFATGSAPNPSVRLSSVAALGYFGDPADLPILQQLAQSDDRLRFAAKEALKNHTR